MLGIRMSSGQRNRMHHVIEGISAKTPLDQTSDLMTIPDARLEHGIRFLD